MKSQLELNKGEITKLHQLAADHKAEISTLTKSVSKSHEVLSKLSEKADHVMLDHKKMKKQNTELQEQNEKLQNDIKQLQSERQTLDEQLNTLRKEKEDLRIKVNDLTRKNEVIQESIKQKIKALLIARLCRGLTDYCSNFGELMGERKEEKSRKPRYQKTPRGKRPSETPSNRSQEVKERLKMTYTKAFGIWSQWVSTMFRVSFDVYLLHGQGPNALLSATNWDEIVIDEETESGQKVHSSIYVPSQ
ncbi:Hypothetical predicted protein, partial [Paramuricea clavata]